MPDAENRTGQGRQGIGREIRRRQGHRQAAVLPVSYTHLTLPTKLEV